MYIMIQNDNYYIIVRKRQIRVVIIIILKFKGKAQNVCIVVCRKLVTRCHLFFTCWIICEFRYSVIVCVENTVR